MLSYYDVTTEMPSPTYGDPFLLPLRRGWRELTYVHRTCGDPAAEERDLVQRRILADQGDALSVYHCVLGKGGGALRRRNPLRKRGSRNAFEGQDSAP